MRLKQLFCMMLAVIAMVSCFSVSAVAAGVDEPEVETLAVYASGRFNMDVPGNTTVKANSSFPLEIGEVVTIKATYSPFSASVDFGLIAPDGLFYSLNTNTGSFDNRVNSWTDYTRIDGCVAKIFYGAA